MQINKELKREELFFFRPHRAEDLNFIYSTWLKAAYFGNSFFRDIMQDTFFEKYAGVIEYILRKKTTAINIACLKEDEDVILGYSVHEPELLHFVFVKDAWRRFGLAKDLIPVETKAVTHLTKIGKGIMPPTWEFDPFRIVT